MTSGECEITKRKFAANHLQAINDLPRKRVLFVGFLVAVSVLDKCPASASGGSLHRIVHRMQE